MQEWHTTKEGKSLKPQCDMYLNIVAVIRSEDSWMPISISGTRTKLKPLRELNNLLAIELGKGNPIFTKSYSLRVIEASSRAGKKYYTFTISPANQNKPLPVEEQRKAYQLYQKFKDVRLGPDGSPEAEDSTANKNEKEF